MARDLEALAASTTVPPTADFVDRVMLAVDAEPLAAPAHVAGLALRRGAIGTFLAAFADAGRVVMRSGFPVAVRAQAFALVLVVAALAAGSGVATAGALGFMQGGDALPSPRPPVDRPSPTNDASPSEPSPSMDAPSMRPADSMAPDRPPRTDARPGHSQAPAATDDHGGSGGGSAAPRSGSGPGPGSGGGGGQDPEADEDPGSGSGSGGGDDGDDGGDDHSGHGGGDRAPRRRRPTRPDARPRRVGPTTADDSGGSSGHG